MDQVTVFECEGGVISEERLYRWKIKNFDEIVRSNKRKDLIQLQRLEFDFEDSNGAKSSFISNLSYEEYPKTDGTGFNKMLQVNIKLVSKADSVSRVHGRMSMSMWMEGTDGKKIFFRGRLDRPESVLEHDKDSHTVDWDINQLSGEFQPVLLDGTLIIAIKLRIFTFITPVLNEVGKEMVLGDAAVVRITRRIAKLENDKDNNDLKIISSDGEEFYAYRWILSEMSEVFEAMFRSDMKEKNSGVLELKDFSGATVKLLLHFIYTGKLQPRWTLPGTVEELTHAAHMYQIT